eukprot:463968_1
MANKKIGLPAGYGNGGIDTMDQCAKLSKKATRTLKNLEITRDMLRQIAANEEKSAKGLQQILNPLKQITRSKGLRFSVVDRAIQNYWRKQEQNRRIFAAALQTKILVELDKFITTTEDQRITLMKRNKKTQQTFIQCKKETAHSSESVCHILH